LRGKDYEGKLKIEKYLKGIASLEIIDTKISELNLGECTNLKELICNQNFFITKIDFLRQLPNPEKLQILEIEDNNIEATALDFLKPFVNLEVLRLGSTENGSVLYSAPPGKELPCNKFYGSLETLKNFKKLRILNIRDTDIDRG